MRKIVDVAHALLLELKKRQVAIDFTCGAGFDTCFLMHHYQQVYAFDIQEDAVKETKLRCPSDNVHVICDSHEHFDTYCRTFDAGIFNLGYLPQGDKTITTSAETVIKTLEKALQHVAWGGRIVLVLYPGFDQGLHEAKQVEEFCMTLKSKHYDVSKIQLLNRNRAPYIICIDTHE